MSEIYQGTIPEPRVVGVRQERSGVSVLTVSIPMVFGEINGLKYPMPATLPEVPNYGFSTAVGKEGPGGAWAWELTYEGDRALTPDGAGKDGADLAVYTLDTSDAEMPITSHPDWLKIKEKYLGSVDANGLITFKEELQVADGESGTKKNPMFKVEAYLSFGAVWTKRYVSKSLPGGLLHNVETVCDIPTPSGFSIPKIGKNRNWLKRFPTVRHRGNVFDITERYLLSGRGGHNRDVYKQEGMG